jgi:hypothetical protein
MSRKSAFLVMVVLTGVLTASSWAFPIRVHVGGGNLESGWTQMTGTNGNDGVVTVSGVTFTASCYIAGDEKWRSYTGGDLGGDYFDCDNGYGNPKVNYE